MGSQEVGQFIFLRFKIFTDQSRLHAINGKLWVSGFLVKTGLADDKV